MAGRTTFLGYRLLSRVAEVLPASAIRPLSNFVARTAVVVARDRADLVAANIRQVTGKPTDQSAVKQAFASYVRFWLESMRLPVVPTERLNATFELRDREHLDAALAAGKGAILALPHMGNWDIAGAWIAAQDMKLTVVVEKLEPPELFVWFRDFRKSLGLEVLVNDDRVGTQLLAALKRNEVIALLSDRDVDGTGKPSVLFGKETSIPRGPATLALRSGAALLPVAAYETSSGHFARVQPAIDTARTGGLKEDVERVTQSLVETFETLIAAAPEQWHAVFQPIWKDG